MRNVRAAESADDWAVTFTYDDEPKLATRIHLLGGQDKELFLCETPSLRRLELRPANATMRGAWNIANPSDDFSVLERDGETTVIELTCYDGRSFDLELTPG